MCTVSWLHTADGYELFCNRDERKSRPVAWGPRVRYLRGVKFIAPLDAQHGGSWLAVNQFGLTLCLLNLYDAVAQTNRDFISRGLLLTDLLDSPHVHLVAERLAHAPLASFHPFTLVVSQPRVTPQLYHWNGATLQNTATALPMMTSSSWETANVIAQREALFRERLAGATAPDAALLRRFHQSHEPLVPAAAVCMHRANAATVSFSHIAVTRTAITFAYTPHAPCSASAQTSYATQLNLVTS
jgi:uncharacterized protein with NRDE domain